VNFSFPNSFNVPCFGSDNNLETALYPLILKLYPIGLFIFVLIFMLSAVGGLLMNMLIVAS